MANQQILTYIKNQQEKGIDAASIQERLRGAGWPDQEIQRAFAVLEGDDVPPPPPPPDQGSTQFEELSKQGLHPRTFWLFLVKWSPAIIISGGLFGVIILANLSVAEQDRMNGLVWLLGIVFVLASGFIILWSHLSYRAYRYKLAEDSYEAEWGVIWKHYTSIPYRRIQNVDLNRGLLERLMKLSSIVIHTAGESRMGGEGHLPGLSPDAAEDLRQELIRRARNTKS